MNSGFSIVEIVLRIVGAFYCFGAIVGARMATRYSFLDHALEAISGNKKPWAERFRERLMLAGLAPVFAGGLGLMFLSPFAPWIFVASAIWQALYLGWLSPRYLDPHDAPDDEGRAKTWQAFWGYLIATVLVLAAAFGGFLRGPGTLTALAAGALATVAFCAWAFWSARNTLTKGAAHLSSGADDADERRWDSECAILEPAEISVILRPSWREGCLFAAETNDPVSWGWQDEHLSEFARDMIIHFEAAFREVGDPNDPRRCALRRPEDIRAIEEAAQPALDLLRQELGADRVRFEPLPAPVEPAVLAARVKIEPFYLDAVIASLDDAADEPASAICEDDFGLSWSLARDLNEWAEDWGMALDDEAPTRETPPSRWTPAEFAAHEERGRVLAVRMKRELAATERAHVLVFHMTRAGLREAQAGEPLPLPAPTPE